MDRSLVPLPVSDGMPTPADLKAMLKRVIQEGYASATEERGPVRVQEDTFPLVRRLGHIADVSKGYASAWTEAAKLAVQLQGEELVEAVGEQDHIPISGLTVPDPEGDLRLTPDYSAEQVIDAQQVLTALCADVLADGRHGDAAAHVRGIVEGDVGDPDDLEDVLATLLLDVLEAVTLLGKMELQVSKVRSYADDLSRRGRDPLAAVVRGAVGKPRRTYKGVKVERKGT